MLRFSDFFEGSKIFRNVLSWNSAEKVKLLYGPEITTTASTHGLIARKALKPTMSLSDKLIFMNDFQGIFFPKDRKWVGSQFGRKS